MSLFGRVRRLVSAALDSKQSARQDSDISSEEIVQERVTAERDDEFVVFHIGMRINTFWKLHQWLPVLLVGRRMVRELGSDEESGLLGSRTVVGPGVRNIGFVQYWDSFDSLRAYARDSERLHFPAWQEYYQDGTNDDAALGIWHETYLVDAEDCETVYNNMPAHGLGACDGSELKPAGGHQSTAGGRLGETDGTDVPVEVD